MIKNKTIIADAKRCLMCYQPICDIACQEKVFPAILLVVEQCAWKSMKIIAQRNNIRLTKNKNQNENM